MATEQVGARPARTTYEITEKGKAEFQSLLRNSWWNLTPSPDPFMAAFSFLPALPREEAAAALRNRAVQLQAGVEQLAAAIDGGLGGAEAALCVLDVGAVHGPGRGRDRLVRADGQADRGRRSPYLPGFSQV